MQDIQGKKSELHKMEQRNDESRKRYGMLRMHTKGFFSSWSACFVHVDINGIVIARDKASFDRKSYIHQYSLHEIKGVEICKLPGAGGNSDRRTLRLPQTPTSAENNEKRDGAGSDMGGENNTTPTGRGKLKKERSFSSPDSIFVVYLKLRLRPLQQFGHSLVQLAEIIHELRVVFG